MISYSLYKVLHIAGVLFLFTALGGLVLHTVNGGTRDSNQGRGLSAATHGIALVVILVSGFGLLARLKLGLPVWAWAKLGIWLLMGGAVAMIPRMPGRARLLWLLLPLLGGVAAWLAIYKPGG